MSEVQANLTEGCSICLCADHGFDSGLTDITIENTSIKWTNES